MARNKYTSELKFNIIYDFKHGLSRHAISNKYKINRSIISRLIKKYQSSGRLTPNHSGGRPRITSRREDAKIRREIIKDPTTSSRQIVINLGLAASERTIRRRAVEAGLFSRRPAKKPLLSTKNRKARLEFAKSHVNWSLTKWKSVLFSDESKFNLKDSDGIRRIRRPRGERLNPKYCIPTTKFGGGNVLVWGCFSGQGMGPIHRIEGIMGRFVYKIILLNVMLPYADEDMPLRWIYQHDNDPKHTSKVCRDCLADNNVTVIDWPSQSPDLNPIENLREIVNRRINRDLCKTKEDLFAAIEEAWKAVPIDIIDNLMLSMPKRCESVIKINGFYTKY